MTKLTKFEIEAIGVNRTVVKNKEVKSGEPEEVLMPSLEEKQLVVNPRCLDTARTLIGCLQVNKTDDLRYGSVERKALLVVDDEKSWKVFGDLHLVEDQGKPENTAMRYQHAVIKDGTVYLRPLMKLASSEDHEIKAAAIELCKKAGIMEENSVGRPQRGAFSCPVMAMGRGCPMNTAGRCAHMSDSADCKIAGDACPLEGPACPLIKSGEGCPMDQWSGCAQLNKEGECGLGGRCALVKADGDEE